MDLKAVWGDEDQPRVEITRSMQLLSHSGNERVVTEGEFRIRRNGEGDLLKLATLIDNDINTPAIQLSWTVL